MKLSELKVVYFGYHNMGVKCLAHLVAQGVQIPLIFTNRPYPGERVWYGSVREYAKENSLVCHEVEDVGGEKIGALVEDARPDVVFSVSFRKLIPEEVLGIPKKGSINIHDSLLPLYRGFTPSTWVIINGEKETGVTMHYMEAEADRGDIISQVRVAIEPGDTGFSLNMKLAEAGLELFRFSLPLIADDMVSRQTQDEKKATYYGRRGKSESDDLVRWDSPAENIYNLVRAITHPIAGAFTYYRGEKLHIWECEVERKFTIGWADFVPGTIVALDEAGIVVRAGDGLIRLTKFQLGGRDYRPVPPHRIGLLIGEVLSSRCKSEEASAKKGLNPGREPS